MTLDDLLGAWAASAQLSPAEIAQIRRRALVPDADELDPDWLWNLMRPVTALLDGPRPLHQTLSLGF